MVKKIIRSILPRSIRPWRIISGQLKGKIIVTSWYDYPAAILGRTEKPLLSWFAKNVHDGETWIDVGAHYGYTSLALCSLVGPKGHVYAFEPMLKTSGYLSRTREINSLNQLTILPFALNSEECISIKNLPSVRGMIDSTLIRQENNFASKFTEKIICSGFDWLWIMMGGDKEIVSGIKIDVQGMEYSVLQGMKKILKTQRPKLIIEFHSGVDRNIILKYLSEIKYSKSAIPLEPVKGESKPQYYDNKSYLFESE